MEEDWYKIAQTISGTTPQKCKAVWARTQASRAVLWSAEEDRFLKDVVEILGTTNWKRVAQKYNKAPGLRPRSGRQCRDHWRNHLDPGLKRCVSKYYKPRSRSPETAQEVAALCRAWLNMGNHWGRIALSLGRNEYWVKKRWRRLLQSEREDQTIANSPSEARAHVLRLAEKYEQLSHRQSFDGGASTPTATMSQRGSFNCTSPRTLLAEGPRPPAQERGRKSLFSRSEDEMRNDFGPDQGVTELCGPVEDIIPGGTIDLLVGDNDKEEHRGVGYAIGQGQAEEKEQ